MAPMQVRRWLVLALIAVVTVSASNPAFAGNRRRGRRSGGGTAASAAMAGQARVLASQAQAQAMQAQAAKNLEAAKAAEIRNRMLWTQAANRENIENGRRSAEASQHDPAAVSQRSLPPKLDRHELDSVTGVIDYPLVLLDSRLDTPRREVDRLFRIRAERGSLDAAEMRELDAALTGFHEELRALVGQYSAGDYGHGATFLERLRYEIRHPEQQLPLESNE